MTISRGSGYETGVSTNSVLLLLLLLEEVCGAWHEHEERRADEDGYAQEDHDSAEDSLQRLLQPRPSFLGSFAPISVAVGQLALVAKDLAVVLV